MKKLLLATLTAGLMASAAQAADMPTKGRAQAPIQGSTSQTWTGPYIALVAGHGWMNEDMNLPSTGGWLPSSVGANPRGGVIGLRVGYDQQVAPRWVVGASGTFSYSGMRDSQSINVFFHNAAFNSQVKSIGDLMVRAGYLANPYTLVYVTGGATWANVNNSIVVTGPWFTPTFTGNSTRWGGTIGGGIELKAIQNVSIGVEYLKSYLGTNTIPIGGTGVTQKTHFDRIMLVASWRAN